MADLSVTATQVLPGANAVTANAIAGATITAGQVLYESSTGVVNLADNGAAATAVVKGIALNGGVAGQPIEYQKSGTITIGAAAAPTQGVIYCLSGTAGGIKPSSDAFTTGEYVHPIGIGAGSNAIKLAINNASIVSL